MLISVIVPCLNEEHNICALLRLLRSAQQIYTGKVEVIVVDGGSDDMTCENVRQFPEVRLLHAGRGRAVQMNAGADASTGDVLYFIHADTRPPVDCLAKVFSEVERGSTIGGFAFQFDSAKPLLMFNSWLTTFNVMAVRGGDQTIFVRKSLFERLSGFSESWTIMEEYDLLKRAKKQGESYTLMKGNTLVSARKYETRSWLRVQLANVQAMAMWRFGCTPDRIRDRYVRALNLNPELSR